MIHNLDAIPRRPLFIINGPYITRGNVTVKLSPMEMTLLRYLLGSNHRGGVWKARSDCIVELYRGSDEPENATVCLSKCKERLTPKAAQIGVALDSAYGFGYCATVLVW